MEVGKEIELGELTVDKDEQEAQQLKLMIKDNEKQWVLRMEELDIINPNETMEVDWNSSVLTGGNSEAIMSENLRVNSI